MNGNPHQPEEPQAGKRAARAPLAAHRLFPAIVALWIAALLALASLALPASLLERAAATIRLDELVPAARPPLGFTARMLLAFALGLGGGGAAWLGAAALRRRALAASPARSPAPFAVPAPVAQPARPLSHAAAGADGDENEDLARLAAARHNLPQRRRALTSETAEAPSILEISAIPALEPLGPDLAQPAPPEVRAPAQAEPSQAEPSQAEPSQREPESARLQPVAPQAAAYQGLRELSGEAAMRLCAAPLETLGVPQLVERFALALKARRRRDAAERGEALPAPAAAPANALAVKPANPAPGPFDEPRAPGAVIITAGNRPFDLPPEAAPPARTDPAAEMAHWALPEPDGESEDIDEELRPDPAATDIYSSLTDLRPATRPPAPLGEFVRIDETEAAGAAGAGPQPVVVFPGQAVPAPPLPARLPGIEGPASAQQTDEALREALAALQRLSGTA